VLLQSNEETAAGTGSMKTAFAHWENRIAPVFDTARRICVVESESGRIVRETQETLPPDLPVRKALRLMELGVAALVCGAISRPIHGLVAAYGIRVVPFVAGDLREVIRAWLDGTLERGAFAMPGCCGRKGRGFGRRSENDPEGYAVNPEGSGTDGGRGRGRGGGGGRGQGPGGAKGGRMGGPRAAGPAGFCVCPQCGRKEPHERGIPCVERKCPGCGILMIRE
jgi:predicted Fe-Mo cluster-binding NifX family protein